MSSLRWGGGGGGGIGEAGEAEEAAQAGARYEKNGEELDGEELLPAAPDQPSWWTTGQDDINGLSAEVLYTNNMRVVADVRDWVFHTAAFEQAGSP